MMSTLPECLQPAIEQLAKYETRISALEEKNRSLDGDIQALSDEKSALHEQILQETQAQRLALEEFENEKTRLRELNTVLSDQLRDKSKEVEELSEANAKLQEQNSRVSSESIRVNAGQEALSHQSQRLNEELEKLRTENESLREQLLNGDQNTDTQTGDASFLQDEIERLMQRHGEITQEKMQASAKMHAAQKDLEETQLDLDATKQRLEHLEFEHQSLQNLHKSLMEERDLLSEQKRSLDEVKVELDERVLRLSERNQIIMAEKEELERSLAKEHLVEDGLSEEVNHLRMKSRRLAEENKELREGKREDQETEIKPLEIDTPQDEDEIVSSPAATRSHFPNESHRSDTEH